MGNCRSIVLTVSSKQCLTQYLLYPASDLLDVYDGPGDRIGVYDSSGPQSAPPRCRATHPEVDSSHCASLPPSDSVRRGQKAEDHEEQHATGAPWGWYEHKRRSKKDGEGRGPT